MLWTKSCWFFTVAGSKRDPGGGGGGGRRAARASVHDHRDGRKTSLRDLSNSVLPFKVLLLQEVPHGVQVSYVGRVVQPHVVLLQRFVAELLLEPFF